MKPEAQRLALAKLDGYTGIEYRWINTFDCIKDWMHDAGRGIPHYLYDLDSLHTLEKKVINGDLWNDYLDKHLPAVVGDENAVECATAPQRAEAILKTFNLWTDDER